KAVVAQRGIAEATSSISLGQKDQLLRFTLKTTMVNTCFNKVDIRLTMHVERCISRSNKRSQMEPQEVYVQHSIGMTLTQTCLRMLLAKSLLERLNVLDTRSQHAPHATQKGDTIFGHRTVQTRQKSFW